MESEKEIENTSIVELIETISKTLDKKMLGVRGKFGSLAGQ